MARIGWRWSRTMMSYRHRSEKVFQVFAFQWGDWTSYPVGDRLTLDEARKRLNKVMKNKNIGSAGVYDWRRFDMVIHREKHGFVIGRKPKR